MRILLACLWVSLSCASQHGSDLEETLSRIIQTDCNPLVRKCGAFVYPQFTTRRCVELHSRKLHGGRLPISSQAKEQVVESLRNHFEYEKDAVSYFKEFAGQSMLYTVSIKKTVAMIQSHYATSVHLPPITAAQQILHAKGDGNQTEIVSELAVLSARRTLLYEQLEKVQEDMKKRKSQRKNARKHDFQSISLQEIPEVAGHGFEQNDESHS